LADPRLIQLPADEPSEANQTPDAAFYLDPADPECWLASERVIKTLGSPAAWTPVLLGDDGSWSASDEGDVPSMNNQRGRRDGARRVQGGELRPGLNQLAIDELVAERGLLPFKPPAKWLAGEPIDTLNCLLATTFAKQAGKTVAFSLALSRQIWCAGRDPEDITTVMLAGAASEIHPNAIEKALSLKSLRAELDRASSEAASFGVTSLPTVRVGDAIFVGDAGLEEAAAKIHG
jgi:2-hydroxychromene-2-carboxylate isomerase